MRVAHVSGACGGTGQPICPNKVFPFVHDFGSILAFTENNFGMKNITYPNPLYADFNAPDWSADHQTIVPLSDFFRLSTARQFVPITTLQPYTYFQDHSRYDPNWVPTGPDDDSAVD
jgi:hypothetical protein